MRPAALFELMAAASGMVLRGHPRETPAERKRGIIVVPGGDPPPGTVVHPLEPAAFLSPAGAIVSAAAASPAAFAAEVDDAPRGDPGIWTLPAEFARPE